MRSFYLQILTAVSFAHDYHDGGSRWDGKCRYGKQQSPIDVHMVTKNEALDIHLNQGYNYYSSAGEIRLAFQNDRMFWDSFIYTQIEIDEIVPGTKRVQTN